MGSFQVVRRAGVIVLVAGLLAAAVLFGLASHKPRNYQPKDLTPQEQEWVAEAFVEHVFGDFGSKAGAGKPFEWSITAEQANAYLASTDAIASYSGRPVRPTLEMEKAGFTGPAVAMSDGVLTLMVQSKRHSKVISLDLGFVFNPRGEMTVRILGMRIGDLPVPRFMLAGKVERARAELVEALADAERPGRPGSRPVPVGELAKVLRGLLDALEGKYIRPELVWRHVGAKHRVLVDRVEITDGQATLHLVPAAPAGRQTASASVSASAGERRP